MGIRAGARAWAIAAALMAVLAVGIGCGGSERVDVSMALDWYPWANHTGLFIAEEKGYYDDQGLAVDIYTPSDPSTVLQTVGAGRDDFGISYQSDVLLARAAGVPVVSIAGLVQHPLNSVMALGGSGIARPRDLVGRKVGYPGIPTNVPLLRTMVEGDGGDFADVEMVNVGFDLVPALLSGKVDAVVGAYWVHESILIRQQGEEVTILRMEEWSVPDFYELVLVASEETVRDRPDLVERFLRAVLRGYEDAAADVDAAVKTLVKANPEVDPVLEQEGIRRLSPLWSDGVPAFGWQSAERWRVFTQWMIESGDLPAGVDPAVAFTNRFVEELSRTE